LKSAIGKRVTQILLEKNELNATYGDCNARHEKKFTKANNSQYDLDHIDALITSANINEIIEKNKYF